MCRNSKGDKKLLERIIYESDKSRHNNSDTFNLDYNNINIKNFKKILTCYETMCMKYDIYSNTMISVFLHDITYAMEKIVLTPKQKGRLTYYMKGYNLKEISDMLGGNVTANQKSIDLAINKIIKVLQEGETK